MPKKTKDAKGEEVQGDGLTIAERVLTDAAHLISFDRESEYGSAHKNYQRIAALWSLLTGAEIDAPKAALMMAALKLDRAWQNPEHRDSYVDLAGYSAIARESAIMDHTYGMAETISNQNTSVVDIK